MKISENVALLLKDCPLLENERISAELFDERLGGVAVLSGGTKAVVREYTDGSKIVEETVRLTFADGKYDIAEYVCEWLTNAFAKQDIYFDGCSAYGIDTGNIRIVGREGFERLETECRIKYLKGTGDIYGNSEKKQ